jgi:hypothetical protein
VGRVHALFRHAPFLKGWVVVVGNGWLVVAVVALLSNGWAAGCGGVNWGGRSEKGEADR